MRVFDCRNGEYIPLDKILSVYKAPEFPTNINICVEGVDECVVIRYDTTEQRDAAFRDAFDVVGKLSNTK